MFSEVLKIIPKLDNKDLSNMEKTLGSRFNRIAKGFAKGIKTGLLGSLGAGILQKLLSPLKEVREAIDRTLKSADDVVTNSNEFGTSTEKLLKLRALGSLKGLDPQQLDVLLNKFQTAVAGVTANPNDPSVSSVKEYAGRTDTADAFFTFMQNLQKLDKNDRVRVQEQIFGEKQILKMAEFLQSDFSGSLKELAGIDFSKVARAVEKLEVLESKDTRNKTINGLNDLINKSKVIGNDTIGAMNSSEVANLARENGQISRFAQGAAVEQKINEISDNIEQLVTHVIKELPILMDGLQTVISLLKKTVDGWKMLIDLIKKSPLGRGIKGLFGGKDD